MSRLTQAIPEQKKKNALPSLFLKLAFSGGLFYWLVSRGNVDVTSLGIFKSFPTLALSAIIFWLFGPIALSAIRWRILLKCAGFKISVYKAIKLQLVGVFFTTALPGSLGGDLVKAYYLISENKEKSKTSAIWSILFDRLVGMCGLFLIGSIFIFTNIENLWQIKPLRIVVILVPSYIIGFAALILILRLFNPIKKETADGENETGLKVKLLEALDKLRVYAKDKGVLIKSVALSAIAHGLSFVFFFQLYLATSSEGTIVEIPEIASIFPIGMLITVLPIAPGGLGIGHFAFSQLFMMIGLSNGANIFNSYFISQILLNLTGVIAYLSIKSNRSWSVSSNKIRIAPNRY